MRDERLLPHQSDLSPLGEIIRKYRQQNNLTQQQLADSCGISVNTLKKMLSGDLSIQFDTAVRLADVLHISLDELAGRAAPTLATASELSKELIASLHSQIKEKDALLAEKADEMRRQDETIKVQRRSIRRYTVFMMIIASLLLIIAGVLSWISIDYANGSFGRYRF